MSKYKVGNIVTGSVTGVENYGIFVSLDEYYSGLIHISEVSHGFVKDINDYVEVGETIKAKVMEIDDETFQLKLSIKDINHRVGKKRRKKIEEVGSGFGVLKDNLPKWIESNILNEKKNKN